ncbi:unnamed protein product [Mycetohabitans rhizoxinica HKI 454]|uniref:Transposase n=1 Tax=Mycetohabitans rhizoxinica (strain DSM 19002 / CIP 109453 / HKI 454) TaxID=882378 RepID=E5AT61_MYCRK|nr:unnamed protein product [Mycetohabitans rhizoxinica HKI 454]
MRGRIRYAIEDMTELRLRVIRNACALSRRIRPWPRKVLQFKAISGISLGAAAHAAA